MNYALNALWWRLQTPQVRDLATLLTAPAPWHTSCELPVTKLLGNEGFRFLLNLDTHPQNLLSRSEERRVGKECIARGGALE